MQVQRLLDEAEKIYAGIHDADTQRDDLRPLWDFPVLLEAYLAMLRNPTDEHLTSFQVVAKLVCPQFLSTRKTLGAFPEHSLETVAGN
jgi:hypothetical protein